MKVGIYLFVLLALGGCSYDNSPAPFDISGYIQSKHYALQRKDSALEGRLWDSELTFANDIGFYRNIYSAAADRLNLWDLDLQINGRASAMLRKSTDGNIYFIQSFFRKIRHDQISSIEDAKAFVAQNVRYEKDFNVLGGRDVYQTGPETVARGVGDCEDHAILLAGLLNQLGYDARVVLGSWMRHGYHAWVVYPDSVGRLRVIEATQKQLPYPDILFPDWQRIYIPDLMFNGEYLWEPHAGTDRSMVSDWIKRSRFEPFLRP